jgi:L-ascorbate metabolism protein UlaG (beta-lactamase superfamily)
MADSSTPLSDHFDGKKFHNPKRRNVGLADILRWVSTRKPGVWPKWVEKPVGEAPPARVPEGGDSPDALRLTFVGHMTFLLQWQGLNILTDPVWSMRASPLQSIGPRRVCAPGIRFEQLPKIDMVLLSHDHYDHLDRVTVQRLWKDHWPRFYTAKGNARRLRAFGVGDVVEMDWWEQITHESGVRVICTPAQHFSGRTPWDRDSTLWCGFALTPRGEGNNAIYFAGDTGFGPHFAEVARRFPRPRLSLLPIGAFRPEWFMGEVHCSPAEAVEAHRILDSQLSVASHFGSFPLADDGYAEPLDRLNAALESVEPGVASRFISMREGEWRLVEECLLTRERGQ